MTLQDLMFARQAIGEEVPDRLTLTAQAVQGEGVNGEARAHGEGDQNTPQFLS